MHILALLKGWGFFVCFELVLFFFLKWTFEKESGKTAKAKTTKGKE